MKCQRCGTEYPKKKGRFCGFCNVKPGFLKKTPIILKCPYCGEDEKGLLWDDTIDQEEFSMDVLVQCRKCHNCFVMVMKPVETKALEGYDPY